VLRHAGPEHQKRHHRETSADPEEAAQQAADQPDCRVAPAAAGRRRVG
jgi:hypothetical protein